MKVLILSHEGDAKKGGGPSRYVIDETTFLSSLGYKVSLAAPFIDNEIIEKRKDLTVVPIGSLYESQMSETSARNIVLNRIKFNELLIKYLECCTDKFDIIHAHGFVGLAISFIKRNWNSPIVSTIHSIEQDRPQRSKYLGQYFPLSISLEQALFSSSDLLICFSNFIRDRVRVHYRNIPENKIITLPPAVNLQVFNESNASKRCRNKYNIEDKNFILFIGRCSPEKNILTLIKAYAIFIRNFGRIIDLVLLLKRRKMTDYYYRSVRKMIKRLELESNIVLIEEPLCTEDLVDLYVESEMVIIPSIYEPFGLVALEAMALRKPVIASNVGGLKEIITDKITGLLFNPRDHHSLANLMYLLLKDDKLYKQISENAYQLVLTKYNWRNHVTSLEAIFKSILKSSVK